MPISSPPTLKVTVPVGVPRPGAVATTWADTEVASTVTDVVVAALPTTWVTTFSPPA